MNTKTRKLTTTALMIALTLVLGLTPIGFLTLPFIGIEITLMCIPVIIGSCYFGMEAGAHPWVGIWFHQPIFGLDKPSISFDYPKPANCNGSKHFYPKVACAAGCFWSS